LALVGGNCVRENGVIAPGQAWRRGKRCNDYSSETFCRDSVGRQSHPVELASGRKRVLRGGGRPPSRSVDSQTESLDIEPRNVSWSGALVVDTSGGRVGTPQRPGVSVPPGSKTQAYRQQGPPGTWEVCRLQRLHPSGPGTPHSKAPGPPQERLRGEGANGPDAALVSRSERNERARRAAEVGVSP
jgi:hypothetical protein